MPNWPGSSLRVDASKNAMNVFQISLILFISLVSGPGPGPDSHKWAQAINSVLDIKGTFPYLLYNISNSSGDYITKLIEPRDYMDFENLYAPNETYRLKQTAQGRNYHLIKAFDFANYYQSDYWHYSSREDLVRSAEPVANAEKCTRDLDWLETQLNRSQGEALFHPGEQHINLMTLVDSYGHPETATYYGHGYWFGSYHECTKVSIDLAKYELEECLVQNSKETTTSTTTKIKEACQQEILDRKVSNEPRGFRYCVGKARDIDWPDSDNYVPRISYKVGLCLPETCETLSFERGHSQQIERLMRFNLPEYTKQRIHLTEIYCVPDPRSPIRQLPLSARIFLGFCFTWLATLVVATIVYSCHKRHQRDLLEISRERAASKAGVAGIVACDEDDDQAAQQVMLDTNHAIAAAAASKPMIPLLEGANEINGEHPKNARGDLYANNLSATTTATNSLANQQHHDASKTAAATPVLVSGHSQFSHHSDAPSVSSLAAGWLAESPLVIKVLQAMSIKETLREFQQPPRVLETPGATKRLRVNLNALDAIKCLCCVLVIFGHIIFIHMQHLSNILHTIELSYGVAPRLLCAFFNFVDTFFIISGMLTAYFIFKRFNKRTFANPAIWLSISLLRLLRLSPVYILVFWFIKTTSVYMTHGPVWDYGTDEKSIKGLCMNDHWWKSILYLGNVGTMQPLCILPAWSIIVDAQYSLVLPVIIFLIFKSKRLGYLALVLATLVSATKMTLQLADQTAVKTSDMAKIRLHVYPLISRFAAEFYNTAWNRIGPVAVGIFGGHLLYLYETGAIRRWPRFMHGLTFKLVLLLHVLIFLLPTIGLLTDNPESAEETDIALFVLSNATIKPIWSIINTILLLRLITDLRSHSVLVRLMSHNIWHCLGKLCFTSYLIHYEIILTLLKSRQEGLIDPNWSNALREFSTVFLISTVLSYVIYILYEAPMNKLIMLIFSKQSDSIKRRGRQPFPLSGIGEQVTQVAAGGGNHAVTHHDYHRNHHHHLHNHHILREQTQTISDQQQHSLHSNHKTDIDHSAMVNLHNKYNHNNTRVLSN